MSGGQILGGVIGAVAGYFIPGGGAAMAMRGMSLGMSIGGYLDPPKGPVVQGPRLEDLTVQSATYGSIIPRVYGTVAVTGNIFWIENNTLKEVETKSSSGGKGGGGQTETVNYLYYATFALGLCKGPISGVRRIWIGSKLIYDAGSDSLTTIIQSNEACKIFSLHFGTDSQLPDDRMQATLGVANTPAYRGLAYIVFKDLPLREYGNTLTGAQVKVEVVSGSYGIGYRLVTNAAQYSNTHSSRFVFFKGSYWRVGGVYQVSGIRHNEVWNSVDGSVWIQQPVSGLPALSNHGLVVFKDSLFVTCGEGSGGSQVTTVYSSSDGRVWSLVSTGVIPPRAQHETIVAWGKIWIIGGYPYAVGQQVWSSSDGATWVQNKVPPSGFDYRNQFVALFYKEKIFVMFGDVSGNRGDTWVSSDGDNWTMLSWQYKSGYGRYGHTGCVVNNEMWIIGGRENGVEVNDVLVSSDGITWTPKVLSPTISHPSSIARCIVINEVTIYFPRSSSYVYFISPNLNQQTVTLASIIDTECRSSGLLSAGDIDITEITKTVKGYRIASVSAIKSSLIQLQGAYPFDVIQSGYKMKFKPRGGESVVTIPASDLGAVGESI